jgi:uncharacterized protein
VDKSRYELKPGLWLDYRRAAYLEQENALAISDLHLGYNWAHRFNGQMLPLHAHNQLGMRISELLQAYPARKLILLGDILHQAVPVKAVEAEMTELLDTVSEKAELILIQGNHDRELRKLPWASHWKLLPEYRADSTVLLHGDGLKELPKGADFVIMGHEHPAINLGDGVATSEKFPAFLTAAHLLILPAFSLWAAGTCYGSYEFMSPLARETTFRKAIAILGRKLLPVPLNR